jgi:aspartyl protease family protein
MRKLLLNLFIFLTTFTNLSSASFLETDSDTTSFPAKKTTKQLDLPEKSFMIQKQPDEPFFWLPTTINGKEISFLFATGACKTILSEADAKKLGINVKSLNYNIPMVTALGETIKGAKITIPPMAIGTLSFAEMKGLVMRGHPHSLFGMNAISQLSDFEMRGDCLKLKQK